MKTVRHPKYFVLLFLALGLVCGSFVRAEEKAPAVPEAPAPQVAPAAPATSAPATSAPAADATNATEEKQEAAAVTESKEADEQATVDEAKSKDDEEKPETPSPTKGKRKSRHTVHSSDRERVNVGGDTVLKAGEKADVVVSILGSSTSAGEVNDVVISVVGSSRVNGGTVGNSVVSVFGGSRVSAGTVNDTVVSVLGDTYVNGHVKGEVVTVLGDVEFGPDAVVDGQVVSVGGEVKQDAGTVLKGGIQNVGIRGVTTWFKECLFKARLLAVDFRIWWAWGVALAFLVFYFLIALVVPNAVTKCTDTLEQRAGSSLITAVLVMMLTPVTYLLLVFTLALGIGVALIPLFSLGLFIAGLFGKVVMLAWLGRRITKLLGDGSLAHPAAGVLIGGVIVLGLYMIPVVGFIIYFLFGTLGLGVVVYTLILQYQAARAARPAPAPKVAPAPVVVAGVPPVFGAEAVPPPIAPAAISFAPPVISAATLPRAGFWIRLCASLLDFILVAIVINMLAKVFHGLVSPGGSTPFWFTVYCVIMWATKGTTIGGVICGLKLVRLDDRPIDWGLALVRALGGFLSFAVAGLGFIWVSFDDERQSWHDKIAGTTIVKVPKGTSLL